MANRIYCWWLVDCSKSIKSVLFKNFAWWILIASSPKIHASWAKLLWQINWGKQWQGQTQDWRIEDSIQFHILGAFLRLLGYYLTSLLAFVVFGRRSSMILCWLNLRARFKFVKSFFYSDFISSNFSGELTKITQEE